MGDIGAALFLLALIALIVSAHLPDRELERARAAAGRPTPQRRKRQWRE